ncbi:MAG: quinolinate synthase NadA [Candidatus Micrarchaeota archaeon]
MNIIEEISRLKEDANAILLAHNYQKPEIQDIADYLGDSLDLCKTAAKTDAEYIVFCGVDFMAETASIFTGKKVLLPEMDAKCPMASMLSAEDVRRAKDEHPGVPVVLYINTLAEAKAEADIVCTSANMLKVIDSVDCDSVLFGPDRNMAEYAKKKTGKRIITIPRDGYCVVHKSLMHIKNINDILRKHPRAVLLAHPECNEDILNIAHYVVGTNGMVRLAKELPDKEFIIATEYGHLYRLSKENPGKKFYGVRGAICRNMKKTTIEKVYRCLLKREPLVRVPEGISRRALKAITRMMEVSG